MAEGIPAEVIRRHDEALEVLLKRQETNPSSRYVGGLSDPDGLWNPHGAAGIFEAAAAAYLCPGSRHFRTGDVAERIRLAAAHLRNQQHEDGTIDLLTTNFHSTPDLGFVVHPAANGALLASRNGAPELYSWIEPFLRRAAGALIAGGIHTPNHRWVVCEALAQLNELMPDPRIVRRIDQWLAEGIDIDDDGQFDERSTAIYNPVTDKAFVVMAAKLRRRDLLDPVRSNLDAMLYLLHPDGEVVTDISRRQDLNARGDMTRYWFALRYLATTEGNGQYRSVLDMIEPRAISLPQLMAWPELQKPLPAAQPLPDNYEKTFRTSGVVRIRRGSRSATLSLSGRSRFFSLRHGQCVVQAVRFASAFFGKGQFVPQTWERIPRGWRLEQELRGPYYQPLDPPEQVAAGRWGEFRAKRRQSEVMELRQSALIRETGRGFALELGSAGTNGVPLSVEVGLRGGGRVMNAREDSRFRDVFLLPSGHAEYRVGDSALRFGPGIGAHRYVEVRGAEPRVEGVNVYLCGMTPFQHTLEFECL